MNDLYVQVEVGFPESKLIDRARESLKVSSDAAIALFVRLWLRTIAVGCHGKIGERSDGWIEDAAGWRGDPGAFAAFVRAHHLDSEGAIRDWMSKYGAVEEGRHKAKIKKRRQRGREGLSPGQVGGQQGDEGGDPSPISNLQSQELSTEEHQTEATSDALQTLSLFLSRHDFGRWRSVVEGFVRSSAKPVNVLAELELHITGEMGRKKNTPEMVGFALNQYAAAHPQEGFKAALFAGFMRGAHRQVERSQRATMNDNERVQQVQEQREREQREQDDRDQQMLVDFERRNETKFEELKVKAESKVDPRYKGETRAEMVRAQLVRLVRAEVK